MDCVIKEVVKLDKSGVCPFSGQKCDGSLNINWVKDYVLIPECKTCISRGQKGVFVEVSPQDLERVKGGDVLMLKASGANVFVKVNDER